MITVYYDGICGACSREISHYKRIAPPGVFNWQDITSDKTDLSAENFTRSDGLLYLHAKDETGKMHIGVDAFLLIWKQIKPWHILAHIVGAPFIKQIADKLYKIFARKRFQNASHCQLVVQQDQSK